MNRPDQAADIFSQGFNCSQAVLAACGTDLGLSRTQCLGVACAFGGGMARTGATCGVVTGAMMVIGLRHGKVTVEDKEGKDRTYKVVHEFMDRFRSRHKSIECRDLLGADISTHEGHAAAMQKKLFTTVCPRLVRDAVEILEQMDVVKVAG